jgi:hypothetical protein
MAFLYGTGTVLDIAPLCYAEVIPVTRGFTMSLRLPLASAAILFLASPLFAQPSLDPEPAGPCLWRIVVKAEPHPLLTASFRDQIRRDLIAALQPAMGPLGTVDVIDIGEALAGKADALVQDFAAKGFAALDTPRDLSGVKTHFLRIEVRDGQYHLESRQHDGFAGLASPVIRKQSTRSPELVGRAAGLIIDRDFGLAGTLDPAAANATEVTIRFRGGKLGPIDRYVKNGDIFALSRITKAANRPAPPPARTATGKIIAPPAGSAPPPAALTPAVHAFTLLKVLSVQADGSAKCAVIRSPNFKATLPGGPAVMGYRCLKLTTVQSPIAVRLASGSDGSASSTSIANVRATELGFTSKEDVKDFLDFRDGIYRSARPLNNIACITVTLGKTKAEHFPVPVLGPEPITLRFELSPEAEARAVFERSIIALITRAADARIAQKAAIDDLNRFILAQKNADALARGRAAFDGADAADKVLTEELQQLKSQDIKVAGAAALFTNIEQQLSSLRGENSKLAAAIKQLEAVVAKENDKTTLPSEVQAQSLNTRINLLIAGGEVEEAIAALDQLATLAPNDANIKARKEKLAAEWVPKNAEHAKQREYMLKTWPTLATIPDMKDSIGRLRDAIDACKKANDRHAFRRLLGIIGGFPARLNDLIKDLDPNTDADRKTLGDAKIVRDQVAKIEQDIIEYLKKE